MELLKNEVSTRENDFSSPRCQLDGEQGRRGSGNLRGLWRWGGGRDRHEHGSQ